MEAGPLYSIILAIMPFKGKNAGHASGVLLVAVMVSIAVLELFTVVAPKVAEAIPAFSRQTEKSCSTCHNAIPKLNQVGQNFRTNGFRFPEDQEWQDIQDLKHVPLSAKLEIAGELNKTDGSAQSSQLKIEDFKLHAATPLGKNGRFSGYGILTFVEKSVAVGQAYGQINDLIGETGYGLLNVKVGTFDIALPFLSHTQRVIKQRYFAQSELGILGARLKRSTPNTDEATEFYNTAVELNGQVVGNEATDITHRYAIGLFQPQDLNDANRLGFPGLYATYAINFLENLNLGFIYKRDVVNSTLDLFSPNDKKSVNKWGAAGEVKVGPFITTVGYFRSDGLPNTDGVFPSNDTNRALQNYMVEMLFIPNKKWVVGARFDHIDQELAQSSSRTTAMGRYNILASVYCQAEWRLTDGGGVGGTFQMDSSNGRVYLVAPF
jgi:hypothetical protein